MPNVLIRDVSPEDLEEIRTAAAERGTSLQAYLHDAMRAQAAYLRRQTALRRTAERLAGRRVVPDAARQAASDAVDDDYDRRFVEFSDPPAS